MGKKRNNIAKKKKATKRFGVSVSKGGTIARNNGVIVVDKDNHADGQNAQQSKNKKGKSNSTAATLPSGEITSISINRQLHTQNVPVKSNAAGNNQEIDEFHRLHASLEERSLALLSRQKETQKKKKGRHSQKKKGWGKHYAHPSAKVDFTPATIDLGPKSTEQLVKEATNHVAMGMTDIGQSIVGNHASPSTVGQSSNLAGQSSLAAAAGLNWQMQLNNTAQQQQQQTIEQNNPFAALDNDSESDDDNDWSVKKVDSKPQFQFQPASFSFQPAQVLNEDVDPDL